MISHTEKLLKKMNKYDSLIIGGTGQFGITLSNQLNKKNKKVIITSRKKINIEIVLN